MPAPVEQIIASMSWAADSGLKELTLTIGSSQVTIRRDGSTNGPAPSSQTEPPVPAEDSSADDVIATLDGICHLSPEPGAARFVSVGDIVEAGQTLCILEAMKMMTPVIAAYSGTVEAIFIEDGTAVDANEALMRIV